MRNDRTLAIVLTFLASAVIGVAVAQGVAFAQEVCASGVPAVGDWGKTGLAASMLLAGFYLLRKAHGRRPLLLRMIFGAIWGQICAKLGRCPRCMRWSLRGSAAAWSAVTVLSLAIKSPSWSVVLVRGIAVALTLLMLAHLFTFLGRLTVGAWSWRKALHAVVEAPERESTIGMDRRAFVTTISRAAVFGVLVGFGFTRAGVAVANAGQKCCYKIIGPISSIGCPSNIAGKIGTLNCPSGKNCCRDLRVCGSPSMQCIVTVEHSPNADSRVCATCTSDYDFSMGDWRCT